MRNGNDLRIVYYEQAVAGYNREASLLFERMNFFLAGMAFLIVALVALIVAKAWTHSFASYSIAVLGLLLSAFFSVVNRVNEANVLRLRDHIYVIEAELIETHQLLAGPYHRVFPEMAPERRGVLDSHPAIHTVLVPVVFYGFWSVMLSFLVWSRGADRWLVLTLIVGLALLSVGVWCWISRGVRQECFIRLASQRLCRFFKRWHRFAGNQHEHG